MITRSIITPLPEEEAQQVIKEWKQSLKELYQDVISWCNEKGWNVSLSPQILEEEALPRDYEADVLTIDTEYGRLVFEPIARIVVFAKGRVDLYAYPAMNRVKLLLSVYREAEGKWTIHTDSGIEWPQPWGKEAFYALAKALLHYR